MSNWIMNNVRISCDNVNVLKEIKYRFFDENGFFSLNLVKPMPAELLNITVNSFAFTYERYRQSSGEDKWMIQKNYDVRHGKDGAFFKRLNATRKFMDKNGGFMDSFSWRMDNWGTKCDCKTDCSWDIRQEPIIDKTMHFCFQTAWNMPHKVFLRLSELMPTAKIVVDYADEELGNNCGRRTYEKGTCIVNEDSIDDWQFACSVWGYNVNELGIMAGLSLPALRRNSDIQIKVWQHLVVELENLFTIFHYVGHIKTSKRVADFFNDNIINKGEMYYHTEKQRSEYYIKCELTCVLPDLDTSHIDNVCTLLLCLDDSNTLDTISVRHEIYRAIDNYTEKIEALPRVLGNINNYLSLTRRNEN